MEVVFLIQPNSMKVNHRGRLKERVKIICLVQVKIYGNKPNELLNKIILKREMKIKVLPLYSFVLIIFLNSW
jgi:hypothetical protein